MSNRYSDEILLYSPGDSSVGIFPSTIRITGDHIIDLSVLSDEDEAGYLNELETALVDLGILLGDDSAMSIDLGLNEQEEKEKK